MRACQLTPTRIPLLRIGARRVVRSAIELESVLLPRRQVGGSPGNRQRPKDVVSRGGRGGLGMGDGL